MVTTFSLSTQGVHRIAISLSREELYVVMRLIKATQLPGFDLNWLGETTEGSIPDETRHALEVATNALVARGYLTQTKTATATVPLTLSMPSHVIALVGTYAFGECSIILSLRTKNGSRLIYLHELHDLGVMHTMPVPNVHQFEAVEGRAGMLRVIDELFSLTGYDRIKRSGVNIALFCQAMQLPE